MRQEPSFARKKVCLLEVFCRDARADGSIRKAARRLGSVSLLGSKGLARVVNTALCVLTAQHEHRPDRHDRHGSAAAFTRWDDTQVLRFSGSQVLGSGSRFGFSVRVLGSRSGSRVRPSEPQNLEPRTGEPRGSQIFGFSSVRTTFQANRGIHGRRSSVPSSFASSRCRRTARGRPASGAPARVARFTYCSRTPLK
jgi:hypothetical protein